MLNFRKFFVLSGLFFSVAPFSVNAGMEGRATNLPSKENMDVKKQAMAPEKRLKLMSQGLRLTNEQQVKIKEILDNEILRRQEIGSDSSLNKEQKSSMLSELAKTTHDTINTFLTPQQKDKFNFKSMQMQKRREGVYLSPPSQEKNEKSKVD